MGRQLSQQRVGLAAQLSANALSGLNSALVELALRGRDPVSFNVELAFCGTLSAILGIGISSGKARCASSDLLSGWVPATAMAPAALAANGLVTGFVIKGGGGIAKAFSSVGAILITAILRAVVDRRPLSRLQGFCALPLALTGIVVYTKYPAALKA